MYKSLLVLAIVILLMDALWLGLYFGKKFSNMLVNVQGETVKLKILPVILTYIMMIFGQYYFVLPRNKDYASAALNGALFGLVTFGIFDFTNMAILNKYDMSIGLQDIAWGVLINTVASVSAFYFCK